MATDKETRILDLIPPALRDQLKVELLQEIEAEKKKGPGKTIEETDSDIKNWAKKQTR